MSSAESIDRITADGGKAPPSTFTLLRRRPETITLALLVVICVAVGVINPAFLSASSLVDLARASVVTGLFALGVFVILAAGGIDVSFTAIAALTMYSLTLLVQTRLPGLPMPIVLLASIVAGGCLGAVNGLVVHELRAPALIVTIGTQYLFRGILLSFIGTVWIMALPTQLYAFGRLALLHFSSASGAETALPAYILALPAAAVLTWWILNHTLFGRAVFAVGGNAAIADRLGFDLRMVRVCVFAYSGALAGLAGMIHVCANRQANPFDLVGTEISVIAAVVLGGARITGGTGSVLGTIFGVLLVVVVNNVLVLVGIPSTWQRLVVGSFILVAAGFFVTQQRKR